MIVRHIVARGRVQGVGYRAFVEEEAAGRGLEGWVRNRRDGTVEAVLAGSAEAVAATIDACRSGPRGARVDAIDETDGGPDLLARRNRGERFSVLSTA